jgi:hypothetical protein
MSQHFTTTFGQVKLGRHRPWVHSSANHRILKMAKYVKAMPPAPDAVDYGTRIKSWGMMMNDSLGDCTCACAGHLIMAWSSMTGTEIDPPDNAILKAYEDVGGYKPGNPNTDNGCIETDVLNYWVSTGIAGNKACCFAAINTKNHSEVKLAAYMFGGIYLGVGLPLTAQNQTVWSTVSTTGYGVPNSWGGHAVPVLAYNPSILSVITWGNRLNMTWDFWDNYVDEAYAIINTSWLVGDKCPAGFDLPTLHEDIKQLAA